eukprot:TRINITY_DN8456_c0_g1_i1.p1 TRINITY_DN8456_c0_g1~~TRINITY_DN8456_c0_g1_i1.p1  ORF type:complete len:449 (-),score=68.84 TRINITY_DN8456_c0_g1_i1:323-1549(-)
MVSSCFSRTVRVLGGFFFLLILGIVLYHEVQNIKEESISAYLMLNKRFHPPSNPALASTTPIPTPTITITINPTPTPTQTPTPTATPTRNPIPSARNSIIVHTPGPTQPPTETIQTQPTPTPTPTLKVTHEDAQTSPSPTPQGEKNDFEIYSCTQIYQEERWLEEWLFYHLHVLGFKNVCLIDVEPNPLHQYLHQKYNTGYLVSNNREQNFSLCLQCFQDHKPDDLLFIHDVDEYLNVLDFSPVVQNHNKYDQFYFHEIRLGFVVNKTDDLPLNSLLQTNKWRQPHRWLKEEATWNNMKDILKCGVRGGWASCENSSGKAMIKFGKVKKMNVHWHVTSDGLEDAVAIDIALVRLNHYYVRTWQDGVEKGKKWDKLESVMGVLEKNDFFSLVYDDSILRAKKLRLIRSP